MTDATLRALERDDSPEARAQLGLERLRRGLCNKCGARRSAAFLRAGWGPGKQCCCGGCYDASLDEMVERGQARVLSQSGLWTVVPCPDCPHRTEVKDPPESEATPRQNDS